MSALADNLARLHWAGFDAVVFDVDGTLYDQAQLRRRMLAELACRCLTRPSSFGELRIIGAFRRIREDMAEEGASNFEQAQYHRTAAKVGAPVERVRAVVREWMHTRPLRHMRACRPDGVGDLFHRLAHAGVRIGVFSDYPAAEKLRALGLECDACMSAEDSDIGRLKPDPAGLLRVLEFLRVVPGRALMVGDREERDGACARRAGCASIILPAGAAKRVGRAVSYDLLFPASVLIGNEARAAT